jgi:type IV pilus assembly protein PilB
MSRNIAPGDFETLLIRTQLLSPAQLAMAKREAEGRHRRLAPMIVELGMVSERRLAEWMSQMTSIPIVDPIPAAAVEILVRRVPRAIAREYEIVPLKLDPGTLTIATMNPLDPGCLDVLHATTALNIRPLIALYSAVTELVARFYPEDNVEPTIMPSTFDPSDTILAGRKPDDSPGSTTRSIHSPPKPESQLDRIEQAIGELRKMVTALQERIDTIDETLEHILSRR